VAETLELLNIHRHLQARGLEMLPSKGPVLAETLYGNVAMRQFLGSRPVGPAQ